MWSQVCGDSLHPPWFLSRSGHPCGVLASNATAALVKIALKEGVDDANGNLWVFKLNLQNIILECIPGW